MIDKALLDIIAEKALIAKSEVGGSWEYRDAGDNTGYTVSTGRGYLTDGYDGEWVKSAAEHAALCDPNTVLEMIREIRSYRNK